ncbi:MAG: hypothetical protein LW804_02060 [Cryomorphaceae bacterium]|jgi:hypothetical protein|nr:hypothetical protein [Cryomorphaceae bacterium]
MKSIFFVLSLLITSIGFSQDIVKAMESILINSVGNAHSEMKSLGLTLDYVQDRDDFIVFLYMNKGTDKYYSAGSIILTKDFSVMAFSITSESRSLTDMTMKAINGNKNYSYSRIKDSGEIMFSNGVYEFGFNDESDSISDSYRVSISKIKK